MAHRMTARATELLAERVPFVHATVVRAQSPTSARAGDDAIILSDGTIEGFVGGQCAEESVRVAALDVLAEGESLLLRVLPDGEEGFPELPGAKVVVNPCLSGGALEVFLEPHVAAAGALRRRRNAHLRRGGRPGRVARIRLRRRADARGAPARGRGGGHRRQPRARRAASPSGRHWMPTCASSDSWPAAGAARRYSTRMDLTKQERDRVHTPVGLDIGARTAAEVALSIMAGVVRAMRIEGLVAPSAHALATGRAGRRPRVRDDRRRRPRHTTSHRRRGRALVLQYRVPGPLSEAGGC